MYENVDLIPALSKGVVDLIPTNLFCRLYSNLGCRPCSNIACRLFSNICVDVIPRSRSGSTVLWAECPRFFRPLLDGGTFYSIYLAKALIKFIKITKNEARRKTKMKWKEE